MTVVPLSTQIEQRRGRERGWGLSDVHSLHHAGPELQVICLWLFLRLLVLEPSELSAQELLKQVLPSRESKRVWGEQLD